MINKKSEIFFFKNFQILILAKKEKKRDEKK